MGGGSQVEFCVFQVWLVHSLEIGELAFFQSQRPFMKVSIHDCFVWLNWHALVGLHGLMHF